MADQRTPDKHGEAMKLAHGLIAWAKKPHPLELEVEGEFQTTMIEIRNNTVKVCEALLEAYAQLEDKQLCKEGLWYCDVGERLQRELDELRAAGQVRTGATLPLAVSATPAPSALPSSTAATGETPETDAFMFVVGNATPLDDAFKCFEALHRHAQQLERQRNSERRASPSARLTRSDGDDVEKLIASVRYNLTGPERAMIEVDFGRLEQAFEELLARAHQTERGMTMKTCPKCGTSWTAEPKDCPECGPLYTKADMEAACELVRAAYSKAEQLRGYKVLIDGQEYFLKKPLVTGAELLAQAGMGNQRVISWCLPGGELGDEIALTEHVGIDTPPMFYTTPPCGFFRP